MKSVTLLLLSLVVGCIPPQQVDRSSTPERVEPADIRLRWIRVYSAGYPSTPPILMLEPESVGAGGSAIISALTLSCDIVSDEYPSLSLQLVHCDRDWNPTPNLFVQDEFRLRASDFAIVPAPIGVQHYDYTAAVTFPGDGNQIEIRHSGNYLARIVDYYDSRIVYGEARFFAVENNASVELQMISDFYESGQSTKIQEGLRASVTVSPKPTLTGGEVESIHLYQRGFWYTPIVASRASAREETWPGSPVVRWARAIGGGAGADFYNIPSGNEHRILDLTDLSLYPPVSGTLTTPFTDEIRYSTFERGDNDGIAEFPYISPSDFDYVPFEFRFDLDGERLNEDIAVIGTFNNWLPTYDWRLDWDPELKYYRGGGLIKRAEQEYMYVAGRWNLETGLLERAEPTLLEGNNVYASHVWYAMAYYRDIASGGYDRIIGMGVDQSGGR